MGAAREYTAGEEAYYNQALARFRRSWLIIYCQLLRVRSSKTYRMNTSIFPPSILYPGSHGPAFCLCTPVPLGLDHADAATGGATDPPRDLTAGAGDTW